MSAEFSQLLVEVHAAEQVIGHVLHLVDRRLLSLFGLSCTSDGWQASPIRVPNLSKAMEAAPPGLLVCAAFNPLRCGQPARLSPARTSRAFLMRLYSPAPVTHADFAPTRWRLHSRFVGKQQSPTFGSFSEHTKPAGHKKPVDLPRVFCLFPCFWCSEALCLASIASMAMTASLTPGCKDETLSQRQVQQAAIVLGWS